MTRPDLRSLLLCAALALATLAAYANHFQNDFHFDDGHTISSNPYIEDLRNIPRFFADATTFSLMPGAQNYRPLVSTSLAIDYWLGQGRKPFWFHLSTFLWFVVQLVLMFFLFRRIMDFAHPHPSNIWTAVLAAACYALHPANAETVNYIVQRADLYCTLGIVASILWFAAYPAQRRRGWYLLPAIAAILSKAPALIYPLILLAYVYLFEHDARDWRATLRATLPAFLMTAAAAIFTSVMTSPTYNPGAASAFYRLTQPWVALRYFKIFFLPTDLSADNDWDYVSGPFSAQALAGYAFVVLLIAIATRSARVRELRPVSFGIWWFFLALLPTSLMPLADVANDHRMFFPFVGLALAVVWSLRLLLLRLRSAVPAKVVAALCMVVLAAEAAGVRARNEVWRTEESLWRDVIEKSPRNIRGLVLYSHIFMARGENAPAIPYLERAESLNPDSAEVQEQLATAYGGVRRDQDAVRHFERAMALAPSSADPLFYYGQWLKSVGRYAEAQALLEKALQIDSVHIPARYVLLDVYSAQKNRPAFDALVQETLRLAQNNDSVRRYVEDRARAENQAASPGGATPESLLHLSSEYGRTGKYEESIAAAQQALALKPDYAEAYNNMAAAYLALGRRDEGLQAATQAVRLKPDFPLARKNLERALAMPR